MQNFDVIECVIVEIVYAKLMYAVINILLWLFVIIPF